MFLQVCVFCASLFPLDFPREGPSPLNPGDSRWKWSKAEESAPQQWAHEQGSQGLKGHAITGHGTWDLEQRRNPTAMSARYRPCARFHKARPTRLTQMKGHFLISLVVGLSGAAEEWLQMVHYAYAIHCVFREYRHGTVRLPPPDRNFPACPVQRQPGTIARQPGGLIEQLANFFPLLSSSSIQPQTGSSWDLGPRQLHTASNDSTKKC